MEKAFKIVLAAIAILYPVAILVGFFWLKASPRILVLGFAAVGTAYFLANYGDTNKGGFKRLQFWILMSMVGTLTGIAFFTQSIGLLKLYPVIMNLFFLASFGFTLIKGPSMIFRFASVKDSSLKDLPLEDKERIERYCRIVTWIWCGFFATNSSVTVFTVFLVNDIVWSIYNGFLAYVLLGLLFGGEILYRKFIYKQDNTV